MPIEPAALLGALIAASSLPGTIELALLTAGALLYGHEPKAAPGPQPGLRLCVVVPAHDEAAGIAGCVRGLLACRRATHRVEVVVVADNCSDDTAALAAAAGARVLERRDAARRGKGYALAHAFEKLLPEGHDAFVVVDADTRVEPNLLEALAESLGGGADAVQCRYLVDNPEESLRTRLMGIAWLAFNDLRPRGREYWGVSVGILGNGFALARPTLEAVPFDAGSIAEDLEYHIRLVRAGRRVRFCPSTTVWSAMPAGGSAAAGQRARWEGGRFRMIAEQAPGLAREVLGGRRRLLEPLLELLLLPLAFHVLLLLFALVPSWGPGRLYALAGLGLVGVHVATALRLGRAGWRDVAALAFAPVYILWKLTLGGKLLAFARRNAPWVRTERENPHGRA
jgi:cellulose synthase/poly-beta-1,6-N-acetylglucosamine synthase-like glycosyltransferase